MKNRTLVVAVALIAVCMIPLSSFAQSTPTKMVGVITKIQLSGADATTATVTLKDTGKGALVVIIINDELTLDKLKDHRIVDGDEIRLKYKTVEGKNVSTYFRKTAGC